MVGFYFGLLVFFLGSGHASHAAIWGADDRKESYEYSPATVERKTGRSVAMLVPWSRLVSTPNGVTLNFLTYQQDSLLHEERLCPRERFQNQPASIYSVGSGFLVAPQVLVTAGHVIPHEEACRKRAVIFGVEWDPKANNIYPIPEQNVYGCDSILKSELQETPLIDYTVIRLNRPAFQIAPLPVRQHGIISSFARIAMAGHPFGLPLKITGGGVMKENSEAFHFSAFLDTYPGNSGSPVIDAKTGLVEGVLVEGESSDITLEGDWPEGCWYSKVYCDPKIPFSGICDTHEGMGAKVIRSTVFAPVLKPEMVR